MKNAFSIIEVLHDEMIWCKNIDIMILIIVWVSFQDNTWEWMKSVQVFNWFSWEWEYVFEFWVATGVFGRIEGINFQ